MTLHCLIFLPLVVFNSFFFFFWFGQCFWIQLWLSYFFLGNIKSLLDQCLFSFLQNWWPHLVNKVKLMYFLKWIKQHLTLSCPAHGGLFLLSLRLRLIFRKHKQKKKPFYCEISLFTSLFIFVLHTERERMQHCVLWKIRAGEKKNPLLSGFPISVVVIQKEEPIPHLDTGHIERIYLGVSHSACSLSCSFWDSSTDECID